jgi:hypothetical protein
VTGDPGAQGEQGIQGIQGIPGDPGTITVTLKNDTGIATIKGYVYRISEAEASAVDAECPAGLDYLAASGDAFVICTGGGIADQSNDEFMPLCAPAVVEVFADNDVALGDWLNLPGATAGQATPAAAPTVGEAIGKAVASRVGAGLVNVLLHQVWA